MISTVLMLLVSLEGQTPQHRRFMQPSLSARTPICSTCTCSNSTNYALWSQDFGNAAWVGAVAGGGTLPVFTASDGSATYQAPDGTNTAGKFVIASCGGGGVQGIMYQGPITTGAGNNTASLWIKGVGSISVGVFNGGSSTGTVSPCTATANGWTQCTGTHNAASNSNYIIFGCTTNPSYTGNSDTGAATLYVWQGQLETGAVATCPILTTTASASRSGACAAVCR
jgi:hypothetical protein